MNFEAKLRHTKIVATLGPASVQRETVASMLRAGMDVVRLNTSHGTIDDHLRAVDLVRSVSAAEGKPVAVLMDLGGPKLRTGPTDGGAVEIVTGTEVSLGAGKEPTTPRSIWVEYPRLVDDVLPGHRVLVDDGHIELEVTGAAPGGLRCHVLQGGMLGGRKGVSFPGSNLTLPSITPRDREALAAGVRAAVDFFALSFVREAGDIAAARELVRSEGAQIPIIAKIERRQAIENLDAILAVSDGAMVARGDLGVELPPEDVPVQQRQIIASAAKHMIPVITATQMLESMIDSPRPTRAESSDVANAVWDVSDALMLSGETAIGRYPVEAVAMMDRIIRRAEEAPQADPDPMFTTDVDDHAYVVALAARRIVERDPNMRGVVCFTRSGNTAFLLSKVHPNAPIYAITPNEAVCRRLSLARSVVPMLAPLVDSSERMLRMVDQLLRERGHATDGEEMVVVASLPVQAAGTTNFLKLHRVGESAGY